jgi:hypothetical protein
MLQSFQQPEIGPETQAKFNSLSLEQCDLINEDEMTLQDFYFGNLLESRINISRSYTCSTN